MINASRSLMCAYKHERWRDLFTHEQFADACREEALRMKKNLKALYEKEIKAVEDKYAA